MWNDVIRSQEIKNQAEQSPSKLEAANLKKIIVTIAISAFLAISALVISPNSSFSESTQTSETNAKPIDILIAGGGDDWDDG